MAKRRHGVKQDRWTLLPLVCSVSCGGPSLSDSGATDGGARDGDAGVDSANEDGPAGVESDVGDACGAVSWAVVPAPAEATGDSFASVAGTSKMDMWVCSVMGVVPGATAVHMLHWNGSSLTEAALPPSCISLWATAPGDVWAGGQAHEVAHLVSGSWVNVNLLDQREAFGIWGNATTNVWFVGDNYAGGHWNGSALTTAPAPTPATSVWGTGDNDLWMIYGNYQMNPPVVSMNVYHVDEATSTVQSLMPSSSTPTNLTGIWAADDAHVWVVGSAGFIGFFDGGAWSIPVSPTTRDLAAVWGSSGTDVWAVGASGTILHWDGASWSLAASPVTQDLVAIAGTDPCNVWAVGLNGSVLALQSSE